MQDKELFEKAIKSTEILKMPKRNLSTFGMTNINYRLLTELGKLTRIREGKVISQRPEIIRPADINELFDGFGEFSDKYADEIYEIFGRNTKILNYKFKNSTEKTFEAASELDKIYKKISGELDEKEDKLTAIIKGSEETWQISVMKFIVDLTLRSANDNISDLDDRGLFPDESGVPESLRNRIDYLFKQAKKDINKRRELVKLLNDYGLFKEYEDRFFRLFK